MKYELWKTGHGFCVLTRKGKKCTNLENINPIVIETLWDSQLVNKWFMKG